MAWLLLGISIALILACGFFVAAEFAFVTVDRRAVDKAADGGDVSAQGLNKALTSLSTQLSGAQVGITITNLAIGFLAEPAIASLLDAPLSAVGVPTDAVPPIALGVGLVLSTALTMIFGELVPKNLAIARPMATGKATQRPMRFFTAVMKWPIHLLNGSANAVVRWFGVEPQEELRSARSSTELASLISRSADLGTLDASTAELMERSVEFGGLTAGEIMTPRMRTVTLETVERASAVLDLARQSGHSRFPVLDDQENVVGTVHVKNVVGLSLRERATTRVKHVMVKPTIVPDSLRLDPLLALLRAEGFQLAVVLDEYGGFAGVVTLEDVVEEIVGDISDEHDPRSARARRLREGIWVVSGLLRPDEVEDITGVELPDDDNYDTVAGLVLKLLGRMPSIGDVAEVTSLERGDPDDARERLVTLTVQRMDGRRIDRLALRVFDSVPGVKR